MSDPMDERGDFITFPVTEFRLLVDLAGVARNPLSEPNVAPLIGGSARAINARKAHDRAKNALNNPEPDHSSLDLYERRTNEFARKNDLDSSDARSQWDVVQEEIEEFEEAWERVEPWLPEDDPLSPELLSEPSLDDLEEEAADVVFTVFLLADLLGMDLRKRFDEKSRYNLQKSGERDENGKIIDDAGGSDA